MPDFKPTARQRQILDRLAAPGARLLHYCPKPQHGGLYYFADALAVYHQGRTVRPLLDAGLIKPEQIEKVKP